jgi:hypothetical protein
VGDVGPLGKRLANDVIHRDIMGAACAAGLRRRGPETAWSEGIG